MALLQTINLKVYAGPNNTVIYSLPVDGNGTFNVQGPLDAQFSLVKKLLVRALGRYTPISSTASPIIIEKECVDTINQSYIYAILLGILLLFVLNLLIIGLTRRRLSMSRTNNAPMENDALQLDDSFSSIDEVERVIEKSYHGKINTSEIYLTPLKPIQKIIKENQHE